MTPELPRLVVRCQRHPSYTGLKRPPRDCPGCEAVRHMRGAAFGTPALLPVPGASDPTLRTSKGVVVRWGAW